MTNATMREWALKYAALGWRVFPLWSVKEDGQCQCGVVECADAGKHPWMKWAMKATTDPATIAGWFADSEPVRNIGLVTGSVSGITVLDIDTGAGKRGLDTWQDLIREKGEPQTLIARTGSGGFHYVFPYYAGLKTRAAIYGPGSGVDCRNDKGYVVAAPSGHKSGGVYEWLNWGTAVSPFPAWLVPQETRGRKKGAGGKAYTIEELIEMLAVIPADDRDDWLHFGIIIGRAFDRREPAWDAYVAWSNKWTGTRGRNHEETMHTAFYVTSQKQAVGRELSMATIIKKAVEHGYAPKGGVVPIQHFVYYAPGNKYLYRPTTDEWGAHAVDALVSPVNTHGALMKATEWLEANQAVTSLTSNPTLTSDYLKGMDCRNGLLFPIEGAALFNTYMGTILEPGDARLAGPFVAHCRKVFSKPGDADQFLNYMAHRVQRPGEKPRFALMLSGEQGIGKDTAVEMCCPALGPWNVANIEPSAFLSQFNEYASAVLVRISEATNHAEMSRWAFNENTKVLIAGSPDQITVNPKYGEKYSMTMYCGVIMTTNSLMEGVYIPEGDRRYDVIECATLDEMGFANEEVKRAYFEDLWEWFLTEEGARHVYAALLERELSNWNCATGQRKTAAHREVVQNNFLGDEWLGDSLREIGHPDYINSNYIIDLALARNTDLKKADLKRRMGATMKRKGYVPNTNPASDDGRWGIEKHLYKFWRKKDVSPIMDPEILKAHIRSFIM